MPISRRRASALSMALVATMALAGPGGFASEQARGQGQPPAGGRGGRGSGLTGLEVIAQRPLITGLNGVVSSNHPLASAAGLRMLLKGGNAIDAAVATAAATSVVDPAESSLGGNGFATSYIAATKEVKAINFSAPRPPRQSPSSSRRKHSTTALWRHRCHRTFADTRRCWPSTER